jgi:8-oxo-dGTP pyrophosphatase MutT (NUDIX family)
MCCATVLLVRWTNEPTSGLWVTPGRKLDIGESPVGCGVREMREETGLKVQDRCFAE